MAATLAKGGFGTLLQIGDGTTPTEVFTTVAEVVDVSPPNTTLETVDATNMESPDGFRERIATLFDSGGARCTLNLIAGNATHGTLRTDHLAKTLRHFRIVLPGASHRFAFSAYITEITPATPMDGKMTQDVVLTTTGKPVFEAVS